MEIHFFAAARAAAGTSQAQVAYDDFTGSTLKDLLGYLATQFTGTTAAGMNLAEVLERCSFLVDGESAPQETSLVSAQRIDVLPPFAGG